MPDLPIPSGVPDEPEVDKGAENEDEQREDLWSPEYTEEQRAFVAQITRMGNSEKGVEDLELLARDMARISADTLAHLGFNNTEIPTGFQLNEDIIKVITYVVSVADEMNPEVYQPLMEQRLASQGVNIDDPDMVPHLGIIAYIYKASSRRASDGCSREGYSETMVARNIISDALAESSGKEGEITADDILKALMQANIRVHKKGWKKSSENVQELTFMILTEIAKGLGVSINIDEDGKPTVKFGAVSEPVVRPELPDNVDIAAFEDNAISMFWAQLDDVVEGETPESLRNKPIAIGGLVADMNIATDTYGELSIEQREVYKKALLLKAKEIFPGAKTIEIEENGQVELFLTVE